MRILIVDDHPMVIEGCRGMLSGQKDIEVFEAHNADEALEKYASTAPDVVVLDINLPGVSGFELLRLLLKRNPSAKVIVFTMNDDPVFAARSETFSNPFGEYALPQAAFKFKQGFGRLIRSKTDRGILVVLDSRLSNKGYGRTFLNSLPNCSVKKGSVKKLPDVIKQWFGHTVN